MAQTYTTDPYAGTGKTADAVMEDVNENFAALKSGFSGTSSPASPVGGQIWHDDATRKVRNYDNDAWLASLMGDASFKVPVYRNDTCDGWTIDAAVTDCVIALKGGSNAYNTDGGGTAGSWTPSGHTHAGGSLAAATHNHKWYDDIAYSTSAGQTYNSSGSAVDLPGGTNKGPGAVALERFISTTRALGDSWTNNSGALSVTGTSAGGSGNTDRPVAAVCTLQYPDLS